MGGGNHSIVFHAQLDILSGNPFRTPRDVFLSSIILNNLMSQTPESDYFFNRHISHFWHGHV